jgi:4'-phosphopantetheinyl transferase
VLTVYWLELAQNEVPAGDEWLGPNEAVHLGGLRFPKRRADWRLGRWTAKCAVAEYLGIPNGEALCAVETRALPGGAPVVFLAERPAPVAISISHSDGFAICAVSEAGAALGCDLERIEPRTDAFAADYFTPPERELLAETSGPERERLPTLLWSAKESGLKVLKTGLRSDTRDLTVDLPETSRNGGPGAWSPFLLRCAGGERMSGWWQFSGGFVRTVAADSPPGSPIRLGLASRGAF